MTNFCMVSMWCRNRKRETHWKALSMSVYLWRSNAEKKEDVVKEVRVSLQVCVCEYVFLWWQNKQPPLSCMALGNLYGFRAPSAWRNSLAILGAACLSLSTPPTSQTAGYSASPTGQVPLNSRQALIWRTEEGGLRGVLGTLSCVCEYKCVCDGVADGKAGGWSRSGRIKGRCPSWLSSCLLTIYQSCYHTKSHRNTY